MKDRKVMIKTSLITAIVILAIFQVLILNKESTVGEKLTIVMEEIKETELENSRLMQKIASSSSMVTISTKAKGYGLTNNQITLSLSSPLPIALLRSAL